MNRYLIDTSAWLEYLGGTELGKVVEKTLSDMKNELYTSVVSIAELSGNFARSGKAAGEPERIVSGLSKVVGFTPKDAVRAGEIYAEKRQKIKDFPLIDAMLLATAEHLGALFLTKDKHFENMENIVLLK